MFVFFLISSLLFSFQAKDYKKYEDMLSSGRSYERRKAVFELKGDTATIAISLLKKVLDDKDIITRRLAISALGISGNKEVLGELHLRFSTKTPEIIRADIVRTYVNFSSTTVKDYILEALEDKSPVVVKEAIGVSAKLKLNEAKPYILDYLFSDNPVIKKASIKAVLNFPIPEAISKIKKIFKKDKNINIRLTSLSVLEKMLDKDDSFFKKVVEDKEPIVSLKGMLFFLQNGKDVNIDKVMEYSYDDNTDVRYEAVKVMAYLIDNEIVKKRLEEMKNDEEERIKDLVISLTGGGAR